MRIPLWKPLFCKSMDRKRLRCRSIDRPKLSPADIEKLKAATRNSRAAE
jgi:hypothetical protein